MDLIEEEIILDILHLHSRNNSLKEFYRILKFGGIVIFKCQDVCSGRKQFFSHGIVMNMAVQLGFYPLDMFVLLAKSRLIRMQNQNHARKYHCYFWVFQKSRKSLKFYEEYKE